MFQGNTAPVNDIPTTLLAINDLMHAVTQNRKAYYSICKTVWSFGCRQSKELVNTLWLKLQLNKKQSCMEIAYQWLQISSNPTNLRLCIFVWQQQTASNHDQFHVLAPKSEQPGWALADVIFRTVSMLLSIDLPASTLWGKDKSAPSVSGIMCESEV